MIEPVTRKEHLLSAIAAGGDIISPVTREEMYLAYMAGDTSIVLPEPVTRKEQFLHQACLSGGSGGGSIIPSAKLNDVTFIDYDGSILYSYSLEEAQALTELPSLPTHDGLVCQGWNWTLEAIKALNRPVTVGAMYITDDGKTRLHIRIATEGRMNVPLYISQTVANGVTIDWGDGSTTETLAGTGNVNTTHAYTSIGDYTITLDPVDGCTLGLKSGSSAYCILGRTDEKGKVYCNMLKAVRIGGGVTEIGGYAFSSCYSLASVTIPDGVTSIGSSAFQYCYGMAEYHLKCTTPPTLSSTNAFSNIPSDCIIYVPNGCLGAYQNATNWATYADRMQEDPT